jgi:iron complex outermembrane recepter protein
MTTHNSIRGAVRRALLMGTAAATAAVFQVHAADDTIQEIVVTGSRISVPNLQSISPVTAISAEDISATGKVRIEDILNQMPQAFAAQGSTISNGSNGTATVDLRGLGAKRTLVLVNGRRLMPGNPDNSANYAGAGAADLNQIPKQLIERVEVLTGGASSVYGADAVGGVVNFILNTRFEGVKVEANYNFYQHKNDNPVADVVRASNYALPESTVNTGYSKDFAFVMGANFADDQGNATFYATYTDSDAILQRDYDYSACTFNSGATFTCGGSGTAFPARLRGRDPVSGDRVTDFFIDPATGGMRPTAATDVYNFGPLNYYQRPAERYTAGAFLNLDVADSHTTYAEFMFMKDRSIAQIAPSGVFTQEASVPCANPLWTDQQRQEFCGQFGLDTAPTSTDSVVITVNRRNIEGGGRAQDFGHESYRTVLGMRGDLTDAWSYDAYGQYGATSLSSVYSNDFSILRTGRALDVLPAPDTGVPTCRSVLDGTDPSCVPYNIWTLDGVTPAALAYLQIPLVLRGETEERLVNASVTGDLGSYGVKLPTANSGLFVNVGVEYREESSELLPDASYQSGDGAGQGGATLPIAGGYRVEDVFTEARMALLEDRPFAHSLSVEAGYRYSDYSLDFTTDTYKLGLEWSPIADLRARASFQRAARIPNVAELFAVRSVGLNGTIDVCAGAAPSLSFEECARTGVTAAQYGNIGANPAAQYNGFVGGTPDLKPEEADTLSFGLAYQPSFVPGLRMQIDYFDIQIDDAIQNPNQDFTLLQCARTGDPALCGRIQRDRDGSLYESPNGFIVDTLTNIGGLNTAGFDFDMSYQLDVGGAGKLGFDFVATKLEKFDVTPQTGVTYDCAGLYGGICGVPAPEWRHKFDTTWRTPWAGLDVTLSWRYFGEVKRDAEDSNEFLGFLGQVTGALPTDSRLGSRSYIDLSAAMTLRDRYTMRVGVSNVADKDPPLNGATTCPTGPCNGNTWSQVYDALGRQIFGLVTIDF